MKKILLFVVLLLSLSACSLSNTPTGKVEAYLNQYNSLTDNVKVDMESKVTSENLSSDNADIYRNVLTRQYQDMKYEVKDEKIDGENATVTVKVTVYDLYKIDRDAYNYLMIIKMNSLQMEYMITINIININLIICLKQMRR